MSDEEQKSELVGMDAPGAPPMQGQMSPADQIAAVESGQTGISLEAMKDVAGDLAVSLMLAQDRFNKMTQIARSLLPKTDG